MEIVDILQLVLLLGLLVSVAILLFNLRAMRSSKDKHDKDEASRKIQLRLRPDRVALRSRNFLNRQLDRRRFDSKPKRSVSSASAKFRWSVHVNRTCQRSAGVTESFHHFL